MADREKLIELIDEAEENAINICVYNSDCEDCPGRKYGNKCREYLKADHLIANGVTVRERGRWITDKVEAFSPLTEEPFLLDVLQCSVCGEYFDVSEARNFCPNCGSDMRGEEDGKPVR